MICLIVCPALWILDQVQNDGGGDGGVLCFEGFEGFVAEVVDDFDADAARRRDRAGA